jgi:4-amino-4-deoxy-L-arabinose transferase-like glycosyltransferase
MPARLRGFPSLLAVIAAVGLAIRLVYALAVAPDPVFLSDANYFHLLANLVADGKGFLHPFTLATQGVATPTAEHPPLYTLTLAAGSALGGTSLDAHRVITCLIGTGTVVTVGLLGRRGAGETVGLVAAGLAAAYPLLWVADGSLMSESLYALLVALALLCALRALEEPSPARLAWLGAAIALATLTRGEALLLVVLLLLPLAWRGGPAAILAGLAAFALVLVPWSVRNLSAFDRPVLVSNNTGSLLAGANCDDTYHGRLLGEWSVACLSYPPREPEDETAKRLREKGTDYAQGHSRRFLEVGVVRVLRTWDFFRPRQQIELSGQEARDTRVQRIGVIVYYPLLVLAVAGAVFLRRRRDVLLVLLAPPAMVTVMSFLGYGITRFRMAAEVSIVVLAALALVTLADRVRERSRASAAAPAG